MPLSIGTKDGATDYTYGLEKKDKLTTGYTEFSIVFLVLSDYVDQPSEEIIVATGLPSVQRASNGAVCVGLRPKQVQTVVHPITGYLVDLWEVEAMYSTNYDPHEKEDPEQKEPTVRWTSETEEEALLADVISGEIIRTAADEPIIAKKTVHYPILEITRYEKYPFDPVVILAYVNKCNSKHFYGAPPGAALMLSIESEREVINQKLYARVTYRIKFGMSPIDLKQLSGKPKKKQKQLGVIAGSIPSAVVNGVPQFNNQNSLALRSTLNSGYKYRKAPGEKPQLFIGKSGNPEKVNLAKDGTILPEDEEPTLIYYYQHQFADFKGLSLEGY